MQGTEIPSLEMLLIQADALFQAKQFEDAEALYETAARHHPPHPTVLIRLAELALRTCRLDATRKHLDHLRRDFPEYQWTPLIEGDLAMEQLDLDRAVDLYREAVARMPGEQAVKARLERAMAEQRSERDWTSPAELRVWPAAAPSRFHVAAPADRVLVVSWDIAHNVVGRGITLAETLGDGLPVALAGPMFPIHGDTLWPPLATGNLRVPIVGWCAPSFRHLLEGALRLLQDWPAGTVWVSKPRFPGLLIGLLYRQILGARVLCDVDDDELAFVKGEQALDFDAFLAAFTPQDWERPQGRHWTELGLGLLRRVDAVTACNPILAARHGATLVRHGRRQEDAEAAIARRALTREELGFTPADQVVLFLGTPRRHKGLLELAQAIVALERPEVVLCIVGSVADPGMEAALKAMPGLRLRRITDQPFSRVLILNAIADLVVLLQDRNSPISQSQTPAKLTDAIAVGIPVLTTDVPPIADVIDAGAVLTIREGDDLTARLDDVFSARQQPGRVHPFFAAEMSYEANRTRALAAIAEARAAPLRPLPEIPQLLTFLRREMPGVLPPELGALAAPHLARAASSSGRIDPDKPINVVFFWKQNDSNLYGRRQDMLLRELANRPEIGRILHVDAPMAVTDLQFHPNPMRPAPRSERSLVAAMTLARMAGITDAGKIHRRSFVMGGEGHTLLGRRVPTQDSFPNAVEAWLEDLDLRDNCIAWVCPVVHGFEQVQQRLRFPFVICDYIDDQRFWPMSAEHRRKVEKNYEFMAGLADVAVANCQSVATSLEGQGLTPLLVPNGIDVTSEVPTPAAEIRRLGGPIIGYCGNMNDRFDFDLVETLAIERPHWQIVLIGELRNPANQDRMKALPNVHLLGIRLYDQARACIAAFDVAIVPHKQSDLSDHMNPLKVYVYRSLGVPVVSTDIANLDDLRSGLMVAHDPAEFLNAIEAALEHRMQEGSQGLSADLIQTLSWKSRMETIWTELDKRLREKLEPQFN